MENELSNKEKELKQYDLVINLADWLPNLQDYFDVFQYMPSLVREKIIEYLAYYWTTIALDSMDIKDQDERKLRKGWYIVLFKLKQVFEWIKLKEKPQEKIS